MPKHTKKERFFPRNPAWLRPSFCPQPIETQLSTRDDPRPAEPCSMRGFVGETYTKNGFPTQNKPGSDPVSVLNQLNSSFQQVSNPDRRRPSAHEKNFLPKPIILTPKPSLAQTRFSDRRYNAAREDFLPRPYKRTDSHPNTQPISDPVSVLNTLKLSCQYVPNPDGGTLQREGVLADIYNKHGFSPKTQPGSDQVSVLNRLKPSLHQVTNLGRRRPVS